MTGAFLFVIQIVCFVGGRRPRLPLDREDVTHEGAPQGGTTVHHAQKQGYSTSPEWWGARVFLAACLTLILLSIVHDRTTGT
jgi:hypothetical protein